ncbi:transporter suffix domain-containing protein [Desulfotomaculum defluvii]
MYLGGTFISILKSNKTALLLIIVSYIVYGFVFIIPFLHLDLKTKIICCSALYITSHVIFWAGTAIIGKSILRSHILVNLLNRLKILKSNNF